MMTALAPIVLFAYNRPEHTRRTLAALARNHLASESTLYCFVDGPRHEQDLQHVQAVREVVNNVSGFREFIVVISEQNLGLARSVIGGVSRVMSKHGKAIVVEDDLLTAKGFLAYMNDALETYEGRSNIFSISGHCQPPRLFRQPGNYQGDVFLSYRNSTTGWGSWLDRWIKVDWDMSDYKDFVGDEAKIDKFRRGGQDLPGMLALQMAGKIDSWGIRFTYAHFLNDAFAVFPVRSFVDNIGHDGSGVHSNVDDRFRNDLSQALTRWNLPKDLQVDPAMLEAFRRIYEPTHWVRAKDFVKRLIGREVHA